jgi:hypothetical protein
MGCLALQPFVATQLQLDELVAVPKHAVQVLMQVVAAVVPVQQQAAHHHQGQLLARLLVGILVGETKVTLIGRNKIQKCTLFNCLCASFKYLLCMLGSHALHLSSHPDHQCIHSGSTVTDRAVTLFIPGLLCDCHTVSLTF